MQNTLVPEKLAAGTFIDLISGAEEVQISEIPASHGRRFFITLTPGKPAKKTFAGSSPYSKDYLVQNATLLLENGDYVLARNLFSFLLKQNIRDTEGLRGLGICLVKMGEHTSAKKCFAALQEISSHPEWRYWLGTIALGEKDDAVAISHFSQVGEPDKISPPLRFDLYKELGNCYARADRLDLAEACYDKALALEPEADLIHVNWGMVEIQKGRFNAAHQRFERALQLNPRNHRALVGIGMASVRQGEIGRAKEAFFQALNLDAGSLVAVRELMALSAKLDSHDEVKTRLIRYLEKFPNDFEVRYGLAALYFKDGQWSQCQREINRVLKTNSAHREAREMYEALNATQHR